MFALPFQKFWKIKLGDIDTAFLFPFLYKGFIIEKFNLSGKTPLVRTSLHI